jgi:hypothetical protein
MPPVRVITTVSACLGLAAFIGVLTLGRIEGRAPRDRVLGDNSASGVSTQAVRRALIRGHAEGALNIARLASQERPDDPDAAMWRAIMEHRSHSGLAGTASRRLMELIGPDRTDMNPLDRSSLAYHRGWALFTAGRYRESAEAFVLSADLYEQAAQGWDPPLYQYNLACYRAMGGQTDRAAEHFALCVAAGYSDRTGWWKADPDLDPIREHPVFIAAAAKLERPAREGTGQENDADAQTD